MSFNDALASVFNNYANFSGRARRKEFWYFFILFNIGYAAVSLPKGLPEYFVPLYVAVLIVPMFSVAARRMHDTGKSALFLLWVLVPFVGWFILAWKLAQDGEPGKNAYGKNPKGFKGKKLNE